MVFRNEIRSYKSNKRTQFTIRNGLVMESVGGGMQKKICLRLIVWLAVLGVAVWENKGVTAHELFKGNSSYHFIS